MQTLAAPVTTAEVVKAHHALTAYVFGNFHRKLTYEEARDVAAEALAEADRAVTGGCEIRDLHQWLRTAAWRNALDAIRRNVGEGHTPRERPVEFTLEEHADRFTHQPDDDFVDAVAGAADAASLRTAWAKLAPDEQRALHLRYFDELPVSAVLDVLGCSRHHYENLTKRALRKLRDALVKGEQDAHCRSARALVIRGKATALAHELATERDAHLDGCLSCRAFVRRSEGLIAAMPLPALGLADRLLTRWHSVVSSAPDSVHAGETLAGATALAGAGAGAAATGGAAAAGGAGVLGAAGVTKTLAVVCSAGAVTAGVCLPTLKPDAERRDPSAQAERDAPLSKRSNSPSTRVVRAAVAAPAPGAATAAPVRRTAAAPARPSSGRRTSQRARSTSPFLPESGDPPQFDTPPRDTTSGADTASTRPPSTTYRAADPPADPAPASSQPATSSDPAPVERAATPSTSQFSQEFTP